MTEDKLIATFTEATRLHAHDAFASGLHPLHVANVLMLSAIEIAVQFEGLESTRNGLLLAAANLGADNG